MKLWAAFALCLGACASGEFGPEENAAIQKGAQVAADCLRNQALAMDDGKTPPETIARAAVASCHAEIRSSGADSTFARDLVVGVVLRARAPR